MNMKIGPLLGKSSHSGERNPLRLAKTFYQSCYEQHTSPIQKSQILQSLGGWPLLQGESWQKNKFRLSDVLKKVNDLGFGTVSIFELSIYTDPQNKTKSWLAIDKGNYEDEPDNEEYRKLMKEIPLHLANKKDKEAKKRIAAEMESVLDFEKQLRYYTPHTSKDKESNSGNDYDNDGGDDDGGDDDDGGGGDDNDDGGGGDDNDGGDDDYDGDGDDDENLISYQTTTIEELCKTYPYLNWLKYLNGILPSGMSVTDKEPILNFNPEYFKKLKEVYKFKRTMANYILWRVFYEIHKLQTEYESCDRDCCIDLTSKKFAVPVTLLYSLKYFNETSRQAAVSLVEDVRHAFIDMLRNVSWMDNDATRTRAIKKAENIVAHVGYPNGMHEINELEEYYRDLKLEPGNFVLNSMRWNLFNRNHMLKRLRKPANRSGLEAILDLKPNKANAHYSPTDNTMQFPIAILHELFFAVDRPQYINYARLGNAIGHEITHGFDNSGRKYGPDGSLSNWWDLETEVIFLKNSKCFVEQYSSYKDKKTNVKINGARTKDENIADNGGTRAAYYAYQNWVKRNRPEELVPGIKFNQRQLFWISYAQAERGVFRGDNLRDKIRNDVHAPNEFRVNGVVSNTPEFAKDFNCAVGSKMNPTTKCKIW